MSVRMAIVKLAALGAAGALIGGGAVHMAEKPKEGAPHYVKHALVKPPVHHPRHVAMAAPVDGCEQDAALVPQNPPGDEQAAAPAPGPYYTTYSACSGRHRHRRHYYAPPPPPPTPVPAPPMLVLFGMAASALVARRVLAQQKQLQPA